MRERVLALDVEQVGGAVRPQRLAVGQQEVEGPWRAICGASSRSVSVSSSHARHAGMRLGQLLHDPAEGALAVGAAHRAEAGVQARAEVLQVAVVREHPVAAPQLAHERVAVLQRDLALRRLADVGDDVAALDRVAADQLGHRRLAGRLVVDEVAQAAALEEGDAPAVGVVVGAAAALRETREAEGHVRRRVAVHPEQLAHAAIIRQRAVAVGASRSCQAARWPARTAPPASRTLR